MKFMKRTVSVLVAMTVMCTSVFPLWSTAVGEEEEVKLTAYEYAEAFNPAAAPDPNNGLKLLTDTNVYGQTDAELRAYLNPHKSSYVRYFVDAPADGTYTLKLGYLKDAASGRVAVFVNDNNVILETLKEGGGQHEIEVAAELVQGRNIIIATANQKDRGRLGYLFHN